MQTVSVNLGARTYPIHIGESLLTDSAQLSALLVPLIQGRQVAVFTNDTVARLYGQTVYDALKDYAVDVFTMADGEAFKNLDTYRAAMDFLMEKRHNRTTCLIALGGGVVGDLTGFVAATFQRGVDFVQLPTTLLAQVDSSVGGKTAVNHPLGKNMIGSFHQPKAVVIDPLVLKSLPAREYAAGLAEVVKYGVIADHNFLVRLEAQTQALNRRDSTLLGEVIKRSCEIKAEIVAKDEVETGVRALLNYGHTFGHALENLSGYGVWLHGEAVSVGMIMAARFSEELKLLEHGQAERLQKCLDAVNLPTALDSPLSVDEMLGSMGMDKKAADGQLRFVVTSGFGQAEVIDSFSDQSLKRVLTEFFQG